MNTNIKKYYVEFVGAHGSGKTYTYHAVTKQNLMAPYRAIYPGQVRRPKLHFALRWPFIAIKNIRHIIFLIGFFLRYAQARRINFKVLRSLVKMIILHPYYYRYDFDVFLKDDMLHMLQRVMFKKKVNLEEAFREYLMHFIYLYDGLIFVDIEPEVMWMRFKERFPGKSHSFKKMRANIHERAWQQSQILRRVITSQTAVPYLVLEGGDNVQDNAQKVVSFVSQKIIAA